MPSSIDGKAAYPPPGQTVGSLEPEDPITDDDATSGYVMNHVMLRIKDPKATLDFYVKLLGMRTIFTTNSGAFSVFYLGYPKKLEHRADPAAYARDTKDPEVLTHTPGLLELCHYHGSENNPNFEISTGAKPPHLGFNHLGFTVPDVKAAVERFRKAGVKIVKDVGQGPVEGIPSTRWEREELGIATGQLSAGFLKIIEQMAFIEDPVSSLCTRVTLVA